MENVLKELEVIVGEEFVITPEKPEYYAYTFGDATMYRSHPDVVMYPGNAEEIQKIIRLANEKSIPVTTSAGLTGLSGGAVCQSGILMNVSRLRKIKSVDEVSNYIERDGDRGAKLQGHGFHHCYTLMILCWSLTLQRGCNTT